MRSLVTSIRTRDLLISGRLATKSIIVQCCSLLILLSLLIQCFSVVVFQATEKVLISL